MPVEHRRKDVPPQNASIVVAPRSFEIIYCK
jgi:hypothetical protein